MPGFGEAVTAIAWSVGGGTGATAITAGALAEAVFTVATYAYTAYSLVDAQRKKQAAQDAANAALSNRLVSVRSSAAERRIVYGRTRVAADTLAYVCQWGPRREMVTMVLPLAAHEVDAIESVWFNDASIGDLDVDGYASGPWFTDDKRVYVEQVAFGAIGSTATLAYLPLSVASFVVAAAEEMVSYLTEGVHYTRAGTIITWLVDYRDQGAATLTYTYQAGAHLVRVKRFLGIAAGERDLDLENNSPWVDPNDHSKGKEWTSAHVGCGVPRIHVTLQFQNDVFGQIGLPNITAIVRGRKVYNWQTGATAWSNNAALCVADYLASDLGFKAGAGRINVSSAQAAQATCDELVNTDATHQQVRYTVDGVLSTGSDRAENLRLLLGAMAGRANYSGGEWRLRAGGYQAPVATLDDDDLADGTIGIFPNPRRADLFNGVRGTFPDPSNLYQTSSFEPYLSSTYAAQDGESMAADIALPMTQDNIRAQRIAKRMLFESRNSLSFTANWKLSAIALQPGDTIRCKVTLAGWQDTDSGAGKLFIVGDRKITPTGAISMTLVETSQAIDAWDYSEQSNPDPAPNTTLPNPRYVAPIAGLTFASSADTYDTLSDGTILPFGLLSWTPIATADVLEGGHIEIIWKRDVAMAWSTLRLPPNASSAKLLPLSAGGTIAAQVIAYNAAGAKSVAPLNVFTVSPDLRATTAMLASPNLLSNPTFAYDLAGWSTWSSKPGVFSASRAGVAGPPSSALIYQGDTDATAVATLYNETMVAVEPGKRYAFGALVAGIRAAGRIHAQLIDVDNNVISETPGNTVWDMVTNTPSRANSANPLDYILSSVFVDAPANARHARIIFVKFGTTAGHGYTDSGACFLEPMVAEVLPGQLDFPVFDSGAQGSVGTGQLQENAATTVWAAEYVPVWADSWFGATKRVAVTTFTPQVTAIAMLTGTVRVTCRRTVDAPGQIDAYFTTGAAKPTATKSVGGKAVPDLAAVAIAARYPVLQGPTRATGKGYIQDPILPGSTATATFKQPISLIAGVTYEIGITIDGSGGSWVIDADMPNSVDYAALMIELIQR